MQRRNLSVSRHLATLVGLVSGPAYERLLTRSDRQTWVCHVQLAFEMRQAANRSAFLLGPHPLDGLQLSVTSAGVGVGIRRDSDALRWLLMCGVCVGDECAYVVRAEGLHGLISFPSFGFAFGRGDMQVCVGPRIAHEFARALVHGQISDRTKKEVMKPL